MLPEGKCLWRGNGELQALPERYEAVHPESEEALAEVQKVLGKLPGLSLAPINGSPKHPFDLDNPFRIDRERSLLWKETASRPSPSPASVKAIVATFRQRIRSNWDNFTDAIDGNRTSPLHAFLKYHRDHGGKPTAFMDHLGNLPDEGAAGEQLEKPLANAIRAWIAEVEAPKAFEIVAALQYEKLLSEELPGFSICPFPDHISIGTKDTFPTTHGGKASNELQVRDPSRWEFIGTALRHFGAGIPDGPLKQYLGRWTYASIAPKGTPNPRDIPNPRHYLLDGTIIPDERLERIGQRSKAAYTIYTQFMGMVGSAWNGPMNLQEQALNDLLDRHFDHGGKPASFVKFVDEQGRGFHETRKQRRRNFSEPIRKALAAWVVNAKQRLEPHYSVNEVPTKSKAKEWTSLRACALFHALLFEANKTEIVNLSTEVLANDVATSAGHGGKGCGKRLCRYFTLYRSVKNRMAVGRLNSTVWKRYDEVICKLGNYPEALAMAKKERKEVYERVE